MKLLFKVACLLPITVAAAVFAADGPPVPHADSATPAAPVAPSAPSQGAAPKIQFESTFFDFGKVAAGQPIEHTFVVSNAGDAVLVISAVHPSCGCTTAGDWTKEVQPGATGKIPIQINSVYLHGTVDKTVTVTSNDKLQPQITLRMHGAVWKPLELSPAFAFLRIAPDARTNQTTIHITNQTDQLVTLSVPESSEKLFTGTLKTLQEGKEFELTVTAAQPFPAGSLQGSITIKTSLPMVPVLNIPVTAIAPRPALIVTPTRISLPPVAANPTVVTQNVAIQATAPQALVLSDASVNADGVDVQMKEVLPGRSYNLVLTFPQGFQVQEGRRVVVSVKSNYPQNPIIRIPVLQPSASSAAAKKG